MHRRDCVSCVTGRPRRWPWPSPNSFPVLVDTGLIPTWGGWMCQALSRSSPLPLWQFIFAEDPQAFCFLTGRTPNSNRFLFPGCACYVARWMKWALVSATKGDQRKDSLPWSHSYCMKLWKPDLLYHICSFWLSDLTALFREQRAGGRASCRKKWRWDEGRGWYDSSRRCEWWEVRQFLSPSAETWQFWLQSESSLALGREWCVKARRFKRGLQSIAGVAQYREACGTGTGFPSCLFFSNSVLKSYNAVFCDNLEYKISLQASFSCWIQLKWLQGNRRADFESGLP